MRMETMGRVLTEAKIENLTDLWDTEKGVLAPDKARSVNVSDALVDTGATTLALPTRLIKQLGLTKRGEKRATSTQGTCIVPIYEAVRLTIQGRDMTVDPIEIPDDRPVLIGQVPLGMLDLVVDLGGRKLIGNPAHGGEHMLELY